MSNQTIASTQFFLYGKRHFTQTGYVRASQAYSNDKTLEEAKLEGKTYIVTGANSGIGFQIAKYLASKGGKVYLVCRNAERGQKAINEIVAETKTAPNLLQLLVGDCGLKQDVERIVNTFSEKEDSLSCLVCNAGALLSDKQLTKEGIEVTFATHLLFGSYLLSKLLTPKLENTEDSRVVFVSSAGMYNTRFPDWKIAAQEIGVYSGSLAYAYCKRGQVLLAEQKTSADQDNKGVKYVSAHPGWTMTPGVATALSREAKWLAPLRTPWQGSEGIAWLCVAPNSSLQGGAFYLDRTPQRKHLAGPFFTEGSFTKNTPEQVQAMMENLEKYSDSPESFRPPADTAMSFEGITLLKTETQYKKGIAVCQTCKLKKSKSYCPVCGEPACCMKSEHTVQGCKVCERCFKHVFAVGTQQEVVISDRFVQDCLAFSQDHCNWEPAKNNKEVECFSRAMPGTSTKAFKCVREMKASRQNLDRLFHSEYLTHHSKWNKGFKAGEVVKTVDQDNNLHYQTFKVPGGTDRDFFVACRRYEAENGDLVFVQRSVVDNSLYPPRASAIRADMPFHIRILSLKAQDVTDKGGSSSSLAQQQQQQQQQQQEEEGESKLPEQGSPPPTVVYTDVNMTVLGGWIPVSLANRVNTNVTAEEMREQDEVACKL